MARTSASDLSNAILGTSAGDGTSVCNDTGPGNPTQFYIDSANSSVTKVTGTPITQFETHSFALNVGPGTRSDRLRVSSQYATWSSVTATVQSSDNYNASVYFPINGANTIQCVWNDGFNPAITESITVSVAQL